MKNLTLKNGQAATFLLKDDWGRPVYELENGLKVCCTELNGTFLHTMTGYFGEPDTPLKDEYQPLPESAENDDNPKESDFEHSYMMLDRLKSDVKYFLGNGSRNPKNLYYKSVQEHFDQMKKLYHSFPDQLKPEWLTLKEILELESLCLKED